MEIDLLIIDQGEYTHLFQAGAVLHVYQNCKGSECHIVGLTTYA